MRSSELQQPPQRGQRQMWAFVTVREEKRIKAVQALSPGIIGKPAAVIVMCLDQSRRASIAEAAVDIMPYFDIGAALQNISLAAHDLGLGSCAIGSFHTAGLAELLNLPVNMQPVLLVTLGTPRKVPGCRANCHLRKSFFQEQYRKSDG